MHKKCTFANKLGHIMNYNHGRKRKIQSLMKLYNDVSDVSGIKRPTVKLVIETLWPILRQSLTEGKELRIPGLGTWQQRYACKKVSRNVNNRDMCVYTPESTHLSFSPEQEFKREHFEENAIIPPPEEYIHIKFPISHRVWRKIKNLYGEEILEKVYKKIHN